MKKKKEKIGTISAEELLRQTRGISKPSFREARYMTEKDRPRKKYKPKDYKEE